MTTLSIHHTRSRLRIIGAIAAKDVTEAIRNKTVLSILVGVILLLLSAQALPLLAGLVDTPRLVVYAPDRELLRALRRQDNLLVSPAGSPAEAQTTVSQAAEAVFAVNLDEPIPAGDDPLIFSAFHAHWLSADKIAVAQADTEAALSAFFNRPVTLEPTGVYPPAESAGHPAMAALTFIMVLLAIGASLVPFLFIEERSGKTLDMLLVSPASYSELVAGKALAGLFYVLAAAVVLLVMYNYLIVQWPLALAVTLLGGLLAVMIGLVFGTLVENQGVLNMMGGLVLMLLLIPPFIEQFAAVNAPPWLVAVLHWLPSTAMGRLLRLSMTTDIPAPGPAADLALMAGVVIVLFLLVVLRLRRTGR